MKNWIRERRVTLILFAVMAVGIGLISYPSIADWWNSFHQSGAVASYASSVARMDTSQYDQMIGEAEEYNKKLAESGIHWNLSDQEQTEYQKLLKVPTSEIMGYINIPKIKVTLPLYHGTDPEILKVAVGHMAGSSLPVGGTSTHCSVSGHRGLPSARLFTDIDKLVAGDTWTITVLNRTITYETDQIRIVEPRETADLQIVEGMDLCTLVTCTPYGVNTHRLLVRGHRIANADGEAYVTAEAFQVDPNLVALGIAGLIFFFLILWLLFSTSRSGRRWLGSFKEKREGWTEEKIKQLEEKLQQTGRDPAGQDPDS